LIIVGFSYREWLQYHRINTAAAETREIIDTFDRIRSGMLSAETSQRGFLLTGEAKYLEPYNRALRDVPARWRGWMRCWLRGREVAHSLDSSRSWSAANSGRSTKP
jgi:CHASE3 domain sensor protein